MRLSGNRTISRSRSRLAHIVGSVLVVAVGLSACAQDDLDATDPGVPTIAKTSPTAGGGGGGGGGGGSGGPNVDYPSTTVSNVTVKGIEVFDDWRHYGRFDIRHELNGATGRDYKYNTSTDNFLGLYDAAVNVYEIDNNFDENEKDCVSTQLIASTKIDSYGKWSVTLPSFTDPCGSDDDPENKIKLRVEVLLQYCDDTRCFSVRHESDGVPDLNLAPFGQWLPSSSTAVIVGTNGVADFGTGTFRDTTTSRDDSDLSEEAAHIFAALVDETRRFHVEDAWPFRKDDYGEVVVRFPTPEDEDGAGVTTGPGTIKLVDNTLKEGWVPLHEYGHILNKRIASFADQAAGGYNRQPCGLDRREPLRNAGTPSATGTVLTDDQCVDGWKRYGEKEKMSTAWSEGFADFVAHVTMDAVDSTALKPSYRVGCSVPGFDVNTTALGTIDNDFESWVNSTMILGCETGGCDDGPAYPTNVARALCDWYDSTSELDDPERTGGGDAVTHSLPAIEATMHDAYEDLGSAAVKADGFTVCDFVSYHIDVGGADEASHVSTIRQNGFDCGY